MTEARRVILEYLADHRFATTGQLYQELHLGIGKSRTHTQHNLQRLRLGGLVKSFAVDPAKGNKTEYGYLLTQKGAEAIGRPYSNKYTRQPSQARLKLRDMELELARTVAFAGVEGTTWSLISPLSHSPSHPLPTPTDQYHKLVEAVDFLRAGQIWADLNQGRLTPTGQSVTNFRQAQQRLGVARQTNDFVAYLTIECFRVASASKDQSSPVNLVSNNKLLSVSELRRWAANFSQHYTEAELPIRGTVAVIFILCPPHAGPKFWLSKLNDYARLARYLPVYGVFDNKDDQLTGNKELALLARQEKNRWLVSGYGSHLNTLTLLEVYEVLSGIALTHASDEGRGGT